MKYPRMYNSLEEFEKMELRTNAVQWCVDDFFEDVAYEDSTFASSGGGSDDDEDAD